MARIRGLLLTIPVLLAACECIPAYQEQFVTGINRQYYADSVAGPTDPAIQFTFETESGLVGRGGGRRNCVGRKMILEIKRKTWVVADSCRITCDKDLPGTKAGGNLIGNPYVEINYIKERPDTTALQSISFLSWWSVPNWRVMPDTATLTFRFKLNNGVQVERQQGIRFMP